MWTLLQAYAGGDQVFSSSILWLLNAKSAIHLEMGTSPKNCIQREGFAENQLIELLRSSALWAVICTDIIQFHMRYTLLAFTFRKIAMRRAERL